MKIRIAENIRNLRNCEIFLISDIKHTVVNITRPTDIFSSEVTVALYHQIFIFGINIVVAELLFVIIELSCSVESVIKQSTND